MVESVSDGWLWVSDGGSCLIFSSTSCTSFPYFFLPIILFLALPRFLALGYSFPILFRHHSVRYHLGGVFF